MFKKKNKFELQSDVIVKKSALYRLQTNVRRFLSIDKTYNKDFTLSDSFPIFLRAIAKMTEDRMIRIVDVKWDDHKRDKSYTVFKIIYDKLD